MPVIILTSASRWRRGVWVVSSSSQAITITIMHISASKSNIRPAPQLLSASAAGSCHHHHQDGVTGAIPAVYFGPSATSCRLRSGKSPYHFRLGPCWQSRFQCVSTHPSFKRATPKNPPPHLESGNMPEHIYARFSLLSFPQTLNEWQGFSIKVYWTRFP